jgi:DNA repair exonuclease SbcCD nuclease subunit
MIAAMPGAPGQQCRPNNWKKRLTQYWEKRMTQSWPDADAGSAYHNYICRAARLLSALTQDFQFKIQILLRHTHECAYGVSKRRAKVGTARFLVSEPIGTAIWPCFATVFQAVPPNDTRFLTSPKVRMP